MPAELGRGVKAGDRHLRYAIMPHFRLFCHFVVPRLPWSIQLAAEGKLAHATGNQRQFSDNTVIINDGNNSVKKIY